MNMFKESHLKETIMIIFLSIVGISYEKGRSNLLNNSIPTSVKLASRNTNLYKINKISVHNFSTL